MKEAIFIERKPGQTGWQYSVRSERIFEHDGHWAVRRDGELLPVESLDPPPVALLMRSGGVATFNRSWPSLTDFGREHGLDL
jgi:hypothetical protein